MIGQGKSSLTPEGLRVLQMLVTRYGMQEDKALQLLKDGGATLAMALLILVR